SEQLTLISESNGVSKIGGVVSYTFIVCVCVTVRLQLSVAVQVLNIMYSPTQASSSVIISSETVMLTEDEQLSVAVNSSGSGMSSHDTEISPGRLETKTGAVVSITLIVCVKSADTFPQSSLKFHTRVRV